MKPASSVQHSPENQNSAPDFDRLYSAQVQQLCSHMRYSTYVGIAAATALTMVLWKVVPHGLLAIWFACFILVEAGRHLSTSALQKISPGEKMTAQLGRRLVLWTGTIAVLWGSCPVLLFPAHSLYHQFLIAVFLIGVSAFNAVAYTPRPEFYVPSILLVLIPLAGRFIYGQTEVSLTIGLAALVLAAGLLLVAKVGQDALASSLSLKFEKSGLIDDLIKTQNELELRVQSRTAELLWANELLRQEILERKRTEEALRESEDKYRALVKNAGEGIFVAQDGRPVLVNPACTGVTGYSEEELLSRPFIDLIHPDDQGMILENYSRRLQGAGALDNYSFRIVTKGGETKWMHINAALINWGGRPGILGMAMDINSLKHAEENLQFENERFQMLANNVPFGLIMVSQNGDFEYINPELKRLFGYDLQQVPNGKTWLRLAHPDEKYRREVGSCWKNDFSDAKPGEVGTRIFTVTCKDGSEKNIHYRTVQMSGGKYLVTCEDITEHTKTMETLQESEAKYRNIIETIADGYHEVDLKGNLVLFNNSLCEMFGSSREELKGTNYRSYMDEARAKKVYEVYNEVYRTGRANPGFYFEVAQKTGTKRNCVVSVALIKDPAGSPIGFRGIVRDVTERLRLEDQLRQAAKMEALGQLAGGVAHDFNNILTAIIGFSDVLIQQMADDSPYREKVLQINRAAVRAANLTRQLLAFSRKQILDLKPLNPNEVLASFEKMLRPLIGEDIELITILDPSAAETMGDISQIEQILLNLAVNARDAMPDGGQLTVETKNVFLDKEYARSHSEVRAGPYVMFAVSDTGHGMDPRVLARIFEPFFTTKAKDRGTGLGLSTVYGIVKQHQGHITAYSEPERGTTFKVYFPAIHETSNRECQPTSAQTQVAGDETILVVEDDEIVRELTAEVLQSLGYAVLQAEDPEEAREVSKLHGGPIHLLLSDVILPRMDGRSLFKSLAPLFPDMKVLFVSGYAENAIVHHGVLDAGVNFLQKPFTVEALARKVRKVLDES